MNLLHHLKATGALLCACLLAGFIVQGAFALEIEEAPLNPEFVDYINHLDSVDENQMFTLNADSVPGAKNYPMGLVPSPVSVNWSGAGAVNADSVIGSELCDLEAVFDLRTEGRVSPVHDQGNLGSCWAFASYGALESNLLPAGVYDFSENNLKNTHGYDWTHEEGGNSYMSSAYLTRWSGPVNEDDDPYSEVSDVSPEDLKTRVHVQNVMFFEPFKGPDDTAEIKQAIKENGAVYHSLYWGNDFYDEEHFSYYDPYLIGAGHAIVLVGWDDTYSKENFTYKPPADGAFIARNSWGEDWGEDGYFYISYYNKGRTTTQFIGEPTTNYGSIYQYDTLGWTKDIGIDTTTVYTANIFTAENDDLLGAVGFYTTQPNEDYDVSVYLSPGEENVTAGSPALTLSGHMETPGYHTLPVEDEVLLTKGEDFSVVVRLTDSWYKYPIAVEAPIRSYSSKATAHAGESFISADGVKWQDITKKYPNTNVCIKAYAKYPSISFNCDNVSVKAGSPSNITVMMGRAPQGIAGYQMQVSLSNPDVAEITGVSFPDWATLNEISEEQAGTVTMKAVDLGTAIQKNAKEIVIGSVTITGTNEGSTGITVTMPMMTADGGDAIVPCDLTTDISVHEDVMPPTPTPVAGGGSGSSGHGSHSDVGAAHDVSAGESKSFAMKESSFSQVSISAKTNIKEMMIVVSDVGTLPEDIDAPTGPVYRYVEAELLHTNDDSIESGEIEFMVPETWLEEHAFTPEEIVLQRYHNGTWQNLSTEFNNRENGKVYFTATTDGFSYFAIAASAVSDMATETPVATPDAVPTGDGSATPSSPETDTPTPAETPQSPIPVWIPIAAAGAALLLRRK